MLLSIGMIVKNEEKNLGECLTALKPLLDSVDSELIIADTGSTDKTVEIAKRFTDNVFYFEWIKDFAAARNATLQRAKGEWFMFVDADEVFTDCGEIISFFNSGEYRKYGSASFVQRNYTGVAETKEQMPYADFNALRLTKIAAGVRFEGMIHEKIKPLLQPTKMLGAVADHFGYLNLDSEKNSEKLKRNTELLLKELESGSNDPVPLYGQLFDCCFYTDREKALYYADEGVKAGRCKNDPLTAALLVKKITLLYDNKDYEAALACCEEFYSLDKKIRPAPMYCDTDAAAYKALSLKSLGRYAEAVEAFRRYFEIFRMWKSGKLHDSDALSYNITTATDNNYTLILADMTDACIKAGKYNIAAEYLTTLPISRYSVNKSGVYFLIEYGIKVFEHFGYADPDKFYGQLDDFGKELLIKRLRLKAALEPDDRILPTVYELTKDEAVSDLIGIYGNDGTDAEEAARAFTAKYPLSDNPDLICYLAGKGLDVSAAINENVDMPTCAGKFFTETDGLFLIFDEYDFSAVKTDEGLQSLCMFFIYMLNIAAIRERPLSPILDIYGKIACASEAQSPEMTASRVIGEMTGLKKTRDYKACFGKLKEVVTVCPRLAEVVTAYQHELMAEYDEYSRELKKNEMMRLSEAIKRNIRALITEGRAGDAKKTLSEYEILNPNDAEIEELKNAIANIS